MTSIDVPLLSLLLKALSTTFELMTLFEQQSLSFHVVSKAFITQNYRFVIPNNIL